MLSLPDLKTCYMKMYSELRNYIWDFNTVECLAELEIAVYKRFPNIYEIRNKFQSFYSCIYRICLEDEYLNEVVLNFKDMINSTDDLYSRIVKPKEV